jgi:predicted ArsR family transcriptional regulator
MEKDNLNRRRIMMLLKIRPMTISQLSKELGVSRPTIYLHLDILEKKGLIKKEKNEKKKGAPVTISCVKEKIEKQEQKELINYLKLIKKIQPVDLIGINDDNIQRMIIKGSGHISASVRGFLKNMTSLSEEGERFLKDNESPKNP